MRQADAAQRQLAERLLIYESQGDQSAATLAEASDRALGKLEQRLLKLIGPAGFPALMARALDLTRPEFPFLPTVDVQAPSATSLRGLRESMSGRDDSQASAALAAVLANLIWLLDAFVGPKLTLRLLSRTWPEIPYGGTPTTTSEETEK